jgi:hypothetical protein
MRRTSSGYGFRMPCGQDYDSHAWTWRGRRHVCSACGLEDLQPARVWRRLLGELRARGHVVLLVGLLVGRYALRADAAK